MHDAAAGSHEDVMRTRTGHSYRHDTPTVFALECELVRQQIRLGSEVLKADLRAFEARFMLRFCIMWGIWLVAAAILIKVG
jgi:hypothetical protein